MLKRRVIPCLDIKNGRVVKGIHFAGIRDPGDPMEAVCAYDQQGADEICLFEVTGTSEGWERFIDIVQKISPQVFTPIIAGGGIRREHDVERLFMAGADKIAINSAIVTNPLMIDELVKRHGSPSIVAAVDVRKVREIGDEIHPIYEVMIHGGTRSTGLEAIEWCKQVAAYGVGEILLTSTPRESTHTGYDLEITRAVSLHVSVPVIASGGVGNLDHLRAALAENEGAADAVLAASIFNFGLYTVDQAKQYLAEHHIPVRPPANRPK